MTTTVFLVFAIVVNLFSWLTSGARVRFTSARLAKLEDERMRAAVTNPQHPETWPRAPTSWERMAPAVALISGWFNLLCFLICAGILCITLWFKVW